MEYFRFDFDCAFDRIGYETIFFSFFQDSRHAGEIIGGCKHDPRFHDDLGYLVAATLNFLELSSSRRREIDERNLGEFYDDKQSKRVATI